MTQKERAAANKWLARKVNSEDRQRRLTYVSNGLGNRPRCLRFLELGEFYAYLAGYKAAVRAFRKGKAA